MVELFIYNKDVSVDFNDGNTPQEGVFWEMMNIYYKTIETWER